ncbi:MAG: thiamine-phosphate kinase [Bacteroidales bacterium]|nr:thiamine-phosphate kinase [Bacteroidales bacterium]
MIEDKNKTLTNISSLGEFGLIDHLTKEIKPINKSSLVGIGDDAAVLDYGDKQILVSTDLLVENVHFDLIYTPLKHLGYKAAVVNFSDICAMNGIPRQITVSLAISSKFSVEAIEELYEGIKLACKKYNVDIIGGDTTSSVSGLMISITVIGEAEKDKIVYRHGAEEGDLIFVSGNIGAAYMGLLILEREKAVYKEQSDMQPDLEGFDYLLERQLKPEARLDIIQKLKELDVVPTAMIDISDGLGSEILHICKQSGVGCNVYDNKFPLDPLTISTAENFGIMPEVAALSGGEDYELLFTIKQSDYEKLKDVEDLTPIGHITGKNALAYVVGASGGAVEIKAQGWDHMKNQQ